MIHLNHSGNHGDSDALPFQASTANVADTAQPAGCARMKIDCLLAYELDAACDFIFLIHASAGMNQTVVEEELLIEPGTRFRTYADPQYGNRFLRLQAAAGPFKVSYRAVVDRMVETPAFGAPEVPVHDIPDNVLRFLMPTRYCESDLLGPAAVKMFGALPRGHARVQAIFEAWLGGRWVLFDPTGMAPVEHVVRVATGRDAKDVAFATIFGPARMVALSPEVTLLNQNPAVAAPIDLGRAHPQAQETV